MAFRKNIERVQLTSWAALTAVYVGVWDRATLVDCMLVGVLEDDDVGVAEGGGILRWYRGCRARSSSKLTSSGGCIIFDVVFVGAIRGFCVELSGTPGIWGGGPLGFAGLLVVGGALIVALLLQIEIMYITIL